MHSSSPEKFSQTSIFDLDETLCTVNTSFQFGKFLFFKRQLPLHKLPLLLACYLGHKIGFLSTTRLHSNACRYFFQGKSIDELDGYVCSFLDEHLPSMLNQTILMKFLDAKSLGHYTVLLSNSPDFLVGEIAKRLDFHEWAATEYVLHEDHRIADVGLLMEGVAKAKFVKNLIERMGISRETITAYSDSFLDIPFLDSVGNPIAVNPDRKLRKLSKQKGWTIL